MIKAWNRRQDIASTSALSFMSPRKQRVHNRSAMLFAVIVAVAGLLGCSAAEDTPRSDSELRSAQSLGVADYNTDSLRSLYIALATAPDSMVFALRHQYQCFAAAEGIRHTNNTVGMAENHLRDSLKRVGDIVQRADDRIARNDPHDRGIGSGTCPGFPKGTGSDSTSKQP
jgi:hypothetical protein